METIVLICIVAGLALAFWLVRYNRAFASFKGPWLHRYPINPALVFLADSKKGLQTFHKYMKEFGDVYHLNMIGQNWVIFSDPKLALDVFRDRVNFQNALKFRQALTWVLGQSMFASEGELWKQKHDIIIPLMSQNILTHSTTIICNKSQLFLSNLRTELAKSKDGSVEIVRLLKNFTLDVIGEVAFGVDFQAQTDNQQKYDGFYFSELADTGLNAMNIRTLFPKWLWYLPLPVFTKEQKASKVLISMFDNIIAQTKEQLDHGEDPKNLPALLVQAHYSDKNIATEVYPKQQMLGECFSIWGAGHDTTTYTCAHLIKLLSRNQDAQAKLREEILGLHQQLGGKFPTGNQINQLPLLNGAFKEVLRLYPVAPFLLREAQSDQNVQGHQIPKGTWVFLNIYDIQRDERFYHHPDEFLPERWSEPDSHNLPLYTFGNGTRSCFGRKLATLEIKLLLFYLLKDFQLLDDSDTHPHKTELNFGLVPEGKRMLVTLKNYV